MKSLELGLRAELKQANKEIERLKKVISDMTAAPYDQEIIWRSISDELNRTVDNPGDFRWPE